MPVPIQLALQGGGAKITYLIAALEALQELEQAGKVKVTRIAGSAGGQHRDRYSPSGRPSGHSACVSPSQPAWRSDVAG